LWISNWWLNFLCGFIGLSFIGTFFGISPVANMSFVSTFFSLALT
jgi:hypothetical protein